jgi:anaerobic C4-dicarboxylate transporter DcuB
MLMFLGFIVLIACLVIGVRRGGIGLATISGIGLVFFIFVSFTLNSGFYFC